MRLKKKKDKNFCSLSNFFVLISLSPLSKTIEQSFGVELNVSFIFCPYSASFFFYSALSSMCTPVVLQDLLNFGGSFSGFSDFTFDLHYTFIWDNKSQMLFKLYYIVSDCLITAFKKQCLFNDQKIFLRIFHFKNFYYCFFLV